MPDARLKSLKGPPHHESVVEVNRDEAEVLGSSML
jgi:hypothetical protein